MRNIIAMHHLCEVCGLVFIISHTFFIYLNHNKKMRVLFILKMIQAKFVAILMENYSFLYIILLENYL